MVEVDPTAAELQASSAKATVEVEISNPYHLSLRNISLKRFQTDIQCSLILWIWIGKRVPSWLDLHLPHG